MFSKHIRNVLRRMDTLTEEYFILTSWKYLRRILLICIVFAQWYLLWKLWTDPPLPEILGDVNGFAPSFGSKPTLFQKEPDFNPLNASDSRWSDLLPELGGGFVRVPSWQSFPLLPAPVRAPSDGTESYNVAVFHQLHCLHSIAELVEELLPTTATTTEPKARIPSPRRKHIEHCFEYLRLSLRCCGDTTLEGQGKTVTPPGIDGFGSVHICRDISRISSWAEENRASDLQELPT
ncbi:hypothetical protein PFICI_12305 [Pestalotiopsis fici W106-1]|uniref:Uncharacterized protein n=1 Tax=Pestalotiopsis fici (strain W106-1 / CGMCC3.15140) TaxID=1229662 RepID=W3WRB5_PESFW|nr:uncharacterized protein PFICI_12305 [Pestalotiopsis fici W106-1]ETS75361.1 hypothetical protein PFICI_12305 [Pestalotiopsis fici W106-1]